MSNVIELKYQLAWAVIDVQTGRRLSGARFDLKKTLNVASRLSVRDQRAISHYTVKEVRVPPLRVAA